LAKERSASMVALQRAEFEAFDQLPIVIVLLNRIGRKNSSTRLRAP
jgi:hypothetical protein